MSNPCRREVTVKFVHNERYLCFVASLSLKVISSDTEKTHKWHIPISEDLIFVSCRIQPSIAFDVLFFVLGPDTTPTTERVEFGFLEILPNIWEYGCWSRTEKVIVE